MAVTPCTISGTLKDADGNAIAGSVIITPSSFGLTASDNQQIKPVEQTVTCDALGVWTADVIQSAMFDPAVTYQFEFRDASGNFLYRDTSKTIPAETSKAYNDL